ncbi:MAG: FAD-dependent oxidoreductase [Deltaproteobacteria bacterium]|jgi:nitrite reductase (NADH) large subunit|nr:FAD-dependent oxidoreductase [Deltaproteobacteria bacterium]
MNVVIAGGGIAGVTAAEAARAVDPKANITVFSLERDRLYFRPRLPEVVAGKVSQDKIFVHPETWYREKNIELRLGESLIEVCQDNHQLRGSLGSRQTYDRLLLATGAESFRPPLPGANLPGVFAVRRLTDAANLYYETSRAQAAVLVGSGLLGLEIGHALTLRGLKVHVLERSDRVLPRQTTPKSGAKLLGLLTKMGFEIHLGQQASRAFGQERFSGVILASGEEILSQILILATGVTPNLDLAKALGLKVERAIVVDEYLETSTQDIYAAGDCAQSPDGFTGLWTVSRLMGLTAGANLMAQDRGTRKVYRPQPPSSFLKVAGIDLIAAGDLDPDGRLTGVEAETETSYRKVVVNATGLLVGFTNLGSTNGNRELTEALGQKVLPPAILGELSQVDFDFAKIKSLPLSA